MAEIAVENDQVQLDISLPITVTHDVHVNKGTININIFISKFGA